MPRTVAYIHSPELIKAASRLPSNLHRAALVHSLVSSYGLLAAPDRKPYKVDDADLPTARVVAPQEATSNDLIRFHDPRYIDAILGNAQECGSDSDRASTSNSTSDANSGSPRQASPPRTFGLTAEMDDRQRKRRKVDALGLQDDCPVFDALPDYAKLVAGASMTAARELRDGRADVAINWTGGRHHGKRGEAAGFCYINDIVLAIMELRSTPQRNPPSPTLSPGPDDARASANPATQSPPPPAPRPSGSPKRISRVLYLDFDVHHGDGVESAFFTSPHVLTLSMHLHAPLFYPASGALDSTGPLDPRAKGAYHALNLALEPGLGDSTFERLWSSCVERIRDEYQPDAVVMQLGLDGLAGDPCKEWNLSLSALGDALERVLSWNKPTLLLGGGGYHSANAARAWTFLTSVALGRPLPLDSPIPGDLPESTYALFGPDWTLDVTAAYGLRDRNTAETLSRVERAFDKYADGVRARWEGVAGA